MNWRLKGINGVGSASDQWSLGGFMWGNSGVRAFRTYLEWVWGSVSRWYKEAASRVYNAAPAALGPSRGGAGGAGGGAGPSPHKLFLAVRQKVLQYRETVQGR